MPPHIHVPDPPPFESESTPHPRYHTFELVVRYMPVAFPGDQAHHNPRLIPWTSPTKPEVLPLAYMPPLKAKATALDSPTQESVAPPVWAITSIKHTCLIVLYTACFSPHGLVDYGVYKELPFGARRHDTDVFLNTIKMTGNLRQETECLR